MPAAQGSQLQVMVVEAAQQEVAVVQAVVYRRRLSEGVLRILAVVELDMACQGTTALVHESFQVVVRMAAVVVGFQTLTVGLEALGNFLA